MKKSDIIKEITNILYNNKDKEVKVAEFGKLRNGRWGLHAYCLCYNFMGIYARPWSGADTYWSVDLTKLKKDELLTILSRAKELLA